MNDQHINGHARAEASPSDSETARTRAGDTIRGFPNFLDSTLPESLWKRLIPEPNSGCWFWAGMINSGGYGQIYIGRDLSKHQPAFRGARMCIHRFMFETLVATVPVGLQLDHLCRQRSCANPAHLEPVTPRENVRRGDAGRIAAALQLAKTHCPQGHEYSVQNTYLYHGTRRCLPCMRARQALNGARYTRAYLVRKKMRGSA